MSTDNRLARLGLSAFADNPDELQRQAQARLAAGQARVTAALADAQALRDSRGPSASPPGASSTPSATASPSASDSPTG